MKKSKGPTFFQRVLDLFQYEDDESHLHTPSPSAPNEQGLDRMREWETDTHRSHRDYNPADKSYESNIDRYRHPSQLYRGR